MGKKKTSNFKDNNQIENQEITNEDKEIDNAKKVEKLEDKIVESALSEKKPNIDEEIEAINKEITEFQTGFIQVKDRVREINKRLENSATRF